MRQNQHQQGFKFPADSFVISSEAKHLISSLLVNDPGNERDVAIYQSTLTSAIDRRLTVIGALKHPFFSMEIPIQIPRSALQTIPTHQALFGTKDTQFLSTPSTSKVTVAIQDAKDTNRCYEDLDIQPPMKIMDETIIDHRSQYPLPNSQKSAMNILLSQPKAVTIATVKETLSTSTASKRPAASSNVHSHGSSGSPHNTPVPLKRLCSDGDIKPTISAPATTTTRIPTSTHNITARKTLPNTNAPSPSSSLAHQLETTQITQIQPLLNSQKIIEPISINSLQESQSQKTTAPISVYSTQQSQSQRIRPPTSLKSTQQSVKYDSQGFGKFCIARHVMLRLLIALYLIAIPTALPSRRPMMEQMEDNIKIMIGRSESVQKENRTRAQQCPDFQWSTNNLFIETWVDCSKHYGFAYRLSDGTLGFLYNDGSVLTCCDSR